MAKLYVEAIISGDLSIEQVPSRWRESVEYELKKLGA